MKFEIQKSKIDESVNFVHMIDDKNAIECRFVHRPNTDYYIIYVSSQTGCKMACRMCHLTATGQNKSRDCTYEEIVSQINFVAEWAYANFIPQNPHVTERHIDFMARGEPLDNSEAVSMSCDYSGKKLSNCENLISTIMPTSYQDRCLWEDFGRSSHNTNIYYSLYSVDDKFRKKWLPRAMPIDLALEKISFWQQKTNKIVRVHHAFIAGQNDDSRSVAGVCNAIKKYNIKADINIVRYNPFSPKYGKESENIDEAANFMRFSLPTSNVSVKPRVGEDVMASCGMFVK